MIPVLTSTGPENPLGFPLSVQEIAWISSLIAAGGVLGPWIGGHMADRIGRKRVILINMVFFIASFILLAVKPSYSTILLARVLQVRRTVICGMTINGSHYRDSVSASQ